MTKTSNNPLSHLEAFERYSSDDNRTDYSHLDQLEALSIFILRETFSEFERPGMLWSMGKDSSVLAWLARKAFFGRIPFPVLHVDTGYKIPEMIRFRDHVARTWNLDLRVGQNVLAIDAKTTFPEGTRTRVECCSMLKRDALRALVEDNGFDGVLLGIRRDEEGTRAKERYFSPRNSHFEWDVKDQPPELWGQFNTEAEPGTHTRVHPLLHWTEINVWEYIDRERIPVVSLYFSDENDRRYRSLGCAPCTSMINSAARTVPEIIDELRTTRDRERSTRAQDQESEEAFELLRASGYM